MFDTYESRAETHQRFDLIEVHSHRFEMFARKVPFEKCTPWQGLRKIRDRPDRRYSIYSFFHDFARKVRDRRVKDTRKTYPLEPCPAQNGLHLAMPDIGPRKRTTYHNDILVASIHSCKQQPIHCLVCIRVCLIPHL